MGFWHQLVAPGFFQSGQVQAALVIGSVVAVSSAVAGIFVVIRGQAFLGHALGDIGATGAAAAALAGLQALWGFLAAGLVGGLAVDVSSRRARERDVATGVVLSAMLGLSALFLYLISQASGGAGVTQQILFGSIFAVDPALTDPIVGFSLLSVALVALLFRPLLWSSVHLEAARARGIPVGLVSLGFLVAVIVTVEEAALVVGALLSTALLVGPAATAIRFTGRVGRAMLLAVGLGLLDVWLGVLLSYDSYTWPPAGRGWPVSFFIVAVMIVTHGVSHVRPHRRLRAGRAVSEPLG